MTKGIKAKDIRDFEKAVQKLDKIMRGIRAYNPDASLFIASSGQFNLCVDSSGNGDVCHEDVVTDLFVAYTDCGDW